MGRMYSAVFEQVSVSAVQDLFELIAPTGGMVIVHSIQITQEDLTASENWNILIHRGTATGSGGSSVTPSPLDPNEAAYGGTCEANNTTQSVEGTLIHAECFNVLNGFVYMPTPECRPVLASADLFIVELQTAPSGATSVSGVLTFEEIG